VATLGASRGSISLRERELREMLSEPFGRVARGGGAVVRGGGAVARGGGAVARGDDTAARGDEAGIVD
jgi:hypothetical protein